MNTQRNIWKNRLLKFLLYVVIGFALAWLYRQIKN